MFSSCLLYTSSPNTPFEQRALDQVNLTIYRGEYLGIIGRTGSGKSTLIQHLNGLIRPTEGEVCLLYTSTGAAGGGERAHPPLRRCRPMDGGWEIRSIL